MKKQITLLLIIAALSLNFKSTNAQQTDFEPSWEVSFGMGQGFVNFFPDFGTSYSTGLSYKTEAVYSFSKRFSYSTSILITTARSNRKDYDMNYNGAIPSVFSHYQTVFAPGLLFTPLKAGKHEINLGAGPVFVFGHSQSTDLHRADHPVLVKNFNEFGYLASIAYKFWLTEKWNCSASYIFNQNSESSEHLMFSIGYLLQ